LENLIYVLFERLRVAPQLVVLNASNKDFICVFGLRAERSSGADLLHRAMVSVT
jgi:hypothetical protein